MLEEMSRRRYNFIAWSHACPFSDPHFGCHMATVSHTYGHAFLTLMALCLLKPNAKAEKLFLALSNRKSDDKQYKDQTVFQFVG